MTNKYTIRLSLEGKDLVEDLGQAYAKLALETMDSTTKHATYEALCLRKKELFEYIGRLERSQRVPQETHVITPFVSSI